jgi:hypothetical protein
MHLQEQQESPYLALQAQLALNLSQPPRARLPLIRLLLGYDRSRPLQEAISISLVATSPMTSKLIFNILIIKNI